MSRVVSLFLLFALIITPVSASDLEINVFRMIDSYWFSVDAAASGKDDHALDAYDKTVQMASEISKQIIQGLEKNDKTLFNEFIALYNREDIHNAPELREPLNLIATDIIEYHKTISKDLTPETYFPGFGYAEPGFVYRKGEEINREPLSVFWKKIDKTYEAGKKFRIQLEVGMTGAFGANAEVKEVGPKTSLNIGGSIKEVVECEVTVKETIVTSCTVKFQKTKVFFKLYKAKKTWLGLSYGEWEECGKTYEVQEEESGLPVVEMPNQLSPQ